MTPTGESATATGVSSGNRSRLERRYRRVLRLLPADYRAVWEEEMVGTFLAASERGRRPWPEALSVVALSVRLRFGGTGTERSLALGEAARFMILSVLLVQLVLATWAGGVLLWWRGALPGSPPPIDDLGPDLFTVLVCASPFVLLAAYVSVLLDRRGAARGLIVASAVLALTGAVREIADLAPLHVPDAFQVADATGTAAVALLPVLGLVGLHRDAPPVRARSWWIALAVGLPLWALVCMAAKPFQVAYYVDEPGFHLLAVVVACGLWLAARGAGRSYGPGWSLALVALAAAVLLHRVTLLTAYFLVPGMDPLLMGVVQADVMETVVLLAAAGPVAWCVSRSVAIRTVAR